MIFIYILLSITFVYLLVTFIIYRVIFYRCDKPSKLVKINYTCEQRKVMNDVKKEIYEKYKLSHEDVFVESFDNLKLFGKLYVLDEKKPIVISFHGYRGNYKDNNLGIKKFVFDNNYNLLLVCQRSHYESEGKTITFGIKERRDVAVWVKYISERFPNNKIILAGTSMGASTVLMASDLVMSKNVCGIIADAPFDSPLEVMYETIRRKKLPVKLVSILACNSGVLFGDFNIKYHTSLKSVKKTKLPILIIHGKNDNTISYKLSEELYKSDKKKVEYHLIDNADHCASYFENPKLYLDIISKFIKKVIK